MTLYSFYVYSEITLTLLAYYATYNEIFDDVKVEFIFQSPPSKGYTLFTVIHFTVVLMI